MKIRLSGELIKDAAGNQDKWEVEGRNTSVEKWWEADGMKKKKNTSLKNLERTVFIRPFYFQIHTTKNK